MSTTDLSVQPTPPPRTDLQVGKPPEPPEPSSPSSPSFPPPPLGSVPVPAFTTTGAQPAVLGSTRPTSRTQRHTPAQPITHPTDKPRITRRQARNRAQASSDDEKVRHAAVSVGVAVAAASGTVVFIGCLVLIIIAMVNAVQVPPGYQIATENGHITVRPPRRGWLDASQVIWTLVILAIVSPILTSLVAWFMARRAAKPLAEALELQRHFVADASHELRTPLTALSSRVQILQRRLDNDKPIDDVVLQLHHDTANMARVLDDMLLTVEGTPVQKGTRTSVVACLRAAVTSLNAVAEQAQIEISLQAPSEIMASVPETSLTRAIVAIVDNAIQHSPSGSTVEVSVQAVDETAVIRVTDHGDGIAGVDPERVFERFSHGSESGRKRSFGLGLALASEVAHRFGGEIRLESTSSHGTTFA
ncbi:MAG: HAMP domain-containing histidine kinase, partial [Propionibacteriaceae bacterium]|nr:HAMP domain-containing histidine kinase [Propionibacteriaceae bacterium]